MIRSDSSFISLIAAFALIPALVEANSGDFAGGVAVGVSYAGISSAPSNGIIIEGNAGIGTASPAHPLHVNGLMQATSILLSDYGGVAPVGTTTAIYVCGQSTGYPDGGCIVFRGNTGAGSSNGLEFYSNGSEQMRLTTGGSVGIGTAAPRSSAKLDVNGTVYIGSFASSSATAVCRNGNVLSSCTSSRAFKQRIKPSRLGLKEVLAMKPVVFDFKDHVDNWEKHDFGFLAEDMKEISPVFVTYDDKGRVEGVRYMQLTAVIAKAIQELDSKEMANVQELRNEITELKQLIKQLSHQKTAEH